MIIRESRSAATQSVNTPTGSANPAGPVTTPAQVRVDVDNAACHLFGYCAQEAPEAFDLGVDGRLRYDARPGPAHTDTVRQAARCCPTQAITLRQVNP